jgi:murein DD-endopeptidase MepM/ murein hydrolase activator NlpD
MSDQTRHDDEPQADAPASDQSASEQSASEQPARRTSRAPEPDEGWELWTKVALMMGVIGAVSWAVVLLRLGESSVYAYAFVIPALGALSVPVMLWGLIKTVFNRPVFRGPRTVGFGVLLAVGLFGNTPYFAVPLSTEDFQSAHTYRLPFEGEWAVTAGGDSTKTNYHATTPTYRFAFDFTPVVDGKRHKSEGKELSDYYCYGEPVFAPASGEVVRVENEHKDNGSDASDVQFDAQSVMGNHVVVRIDDDEYLFVAHMKEGSIPVDNGDQITTGQEIGKCGNSGRSLKPNVHVHLQNSKEFPVAESLPLIFSDYVADGEPVDKGMPQGPADPESRFGQRVKNAKSNSN